MKRSQQEQEIFTKIAGFYIEKSGGDYTKAIKNAKEVGFRRIELFGDNVVVWVKQVGLFIGRRGENVDKLQKHLSKKIYIKEVEGDAEDSIVWAITDQHDMDHTLRGDYDYSSESAFDVIYGDADEDNFGNKF